MGKWVAEFGGQDSAKYWKKKPGAAGYDVVFGIGNSLPKDL